MTVPTPEPQVDNPYTPPASQADLDKIISERLRREREKFADYNDLKSKAQQYDALEEQKKTELERVAERAAQAEERASKAELKALRAEVAATKGVPASLLAGTTQAELEASADALLEFRGTHVAQTVSVLTPGGEPPKKGGREAGLAEAQKRFGEKK